MDSYLNSSSATLPSFQDGDTVTMTMSVPAYAKRAPRVVAADEGSGFWSTVLALFAIDLVAIASVAGLIGVLTTVVGTAPEWTVYSVGGVALLVLPFVYAGCGLYRVIDIHPAEELRQMSTISMAMGLAAALGALPWASGVALILAVGAVLVAIVVPACRVLGRILLARTDWWGVPAVVLGTGSHGKTVITTLKRWPELGFRPVALLQEGRLGAYAEVPHPAGPDWAPNLAQTHHVPYAIVAMPNLSCKERSRVIAHVGKFFRQLFVVPEEGGPAALWTARSSSQGLLGSRVKHFRSSKAARGIKRALDVTGAALGLLVFAPLIVTIAALIKMDSRGPVFFTQERMGMEGRGFTVYKFRTMYQDAEAKLQEILDTNTELQKQYEKYHKLENDPRVTRVGHWLRRLSLDELPQLWNVLRGDMSLVGPRAYMPSELPKMNGLSRSVLQCPPGLTGLWQVSGRNNLEFSTRVDLDVHYIQNWTLWLDIYILLRTIPVVLTADGAK